MLFHTPQFALFLTAILLILAVLRSDGPRKIVLLLASYFFYMWWNPIFVLPLLATTMIDYHVGRLLGSEERPARRRTLLIASLVANLGLLAYFKYFNFFVLNFVAMARAFGFDFSPALATVILPIGISFYTFHSMSYTIDVYRRQIPVCSSPLRFALFITFFPVLVAGPILRAKQFLPQLEQKIRLRVTTPIVMLIVRGLVKKVLIADNVGPFADAVFADPARWPSITIWMATVAFSVQIYCDFSGYSDIARGLAAIFGYEIPLNFDRPYFARSPAEFWRRWHISLSSWLRDYLYIPLGGNRHGRWQTYRNLLLTMLLGGLWHGASWNFVLWGFFHGVLLSIQRLFREIRGARSPLSALGAVGARAATQYCVLLSWILFRVTNTEKMLVAVRKFVVFDFDFSLENLGLAALSFSFTLVILAAFWLLHIEAWRRGDLDARIARMPLAAAAALCAVIGACFVVLWPMAEKPFIYFRF